MTEPFPIPPALLDAIAKAGQLLDQAARDRLAAQAQKALAQIDKLNIGETLAKVASLREQVEASLPANWRDLDYEEFSALLDLVENNPDVSLVWVPRTTIIREVLACESPAERENALCRRRSEILQDAEVTLGEATITASDAQRELADAVEEALRAARAGLDRAAQALLAGCLGIVVHKIHGYEQLAAARDRFSDTDPDGAGASQLKLVCLQAVTANALVATWKNPAGFNRHGTQHGASEYFSEAQMLAGLLLLVGWVRELSWVAEHFPEVLESS